jgi:hypothetical protein
MDGPTLVTSDIGEAAFLAVSGLRLARVEHGRPSRFVFLDDGRGLALRERYVRDRFARRLFSKKRLMHHALQIAAASPTGVCTARDLFAAQRALPAWERW